MRALPGPGHVVAPGRLGPPDTASDSADGVMVSASLTRTGSSEASSSASDTGRSPSRFATRTIECLDETQTNISSTPLGSAALLATGAVVIAFGEKRFDQCLTHVGGLGLVDLDTHAVADRHRAGGDHAAIDVDHTCPARAKGRVVFQITQGGDVHTRLGGDIDFGRIRA